MADSTLKHAASLVPVGAFAGKPAMPLTRSVVVVGSGPHARFLLKSDTVSTSHALFIHTSAGWYFRDLVSRTHTILNGKSLRESQIKSGDTLTIGKFVFSFVAVGTPAEAPPLKPAALDITDAEIPVPIDTRTMLIGRRVGCEVRLIEESVSLVHACLFESDGVHYIRDLYSRTGTFLNGKKIHQEALKFGDIIVIGETSLRYIADESTNDQAGDLVELEPFGVAEPTGARSDDSLLNGSLSDGSMLAGSGLGASIAGGSLAGASLAGASAAGTSAPGASAENAAIEKPERDRSPVSLTPTESVPTAIEEAAGAGVSLGDVASDRNEEISLAPHAGDATPPAIARATDAIDLVEANAADGSASHESIADVRVVPVNRRDAFDAPADEIVDEVETPTVEVVAPVPAISVEEIIAEPVELEAIADLETPAEHAAKVDIDALEPAALDAEIGTSDALTAEIEEEHAVEIEAVRENEQPEAPLPQVTAASEAIVAAPEVVATPAELPLPPADFARAADIEPIEADELDIVAAAPSIELPEIEELVTEPDAAVDLEGDTTDADADAAERAADRARVLAEEIEADVLGLPVTGLDQESISSRKAFETPVVAEPEQTPPEQLEALAPEASEPEEPRTEAPTLELTAAPQAVEEIAPAVIEDSASIRETIADAPLVVDDEANASVEEAAAPPAEAIADLDVIDEAKPFEPLAEAHAEPTVETPAAETQLPEASEPEASEPAAKPMPKAPAAKRVSPMAAWRKSLAELAASDAEPLDDGLPTPITAPIAPLPVASPSIAPPAVAPFAAAEHADADHPQHTGIEPMIAHADADENATAIPLAQAEVTDALHEHLNDDLHDAIEAPGIEPSALPPSPEVTVLAALQERIRVALADPSTMARQPLLASEPDAPAPKLSEAARRARTIAELLESNEGYEEEAEREAQAISFPPLDESAIAVDEVLVPAMLPPVEVPNWIEFDLREAEAEAEVAEPVVETTAESTNVVEARGPAEIAELMRAADSGVSATHDVAGEAGPLALAAGESAVMGDEEDLVAAAPALDDVAAEQTSDAVEELAEAQAQTTETPIESIDAIEVSTETSDAAAGPAIVSNAFYTGEPMPGESIVSESAPDAITEPVGESTIDGSAETPIEELPVKGRRGRKPPAAPKPKKTPVRKPPRGKKAIAEAEAAAAAEAAAEVIAPSAATPAILSPFNDTVAVATTDPLAADATAPGTVAISVDASALTITDAIETSSLEATPHVGLIGDAEADSLSSADEHITVSVAAPVTDSIDETIADKTIADATAPLAAIEEAQDQAAPTTLDAIVHAHQPAPLPIEEVLAPTDLAIEPDELVTQIDDARAPVEADAYYAGEVIVTAPVTINEVPIETVAPMFDPDPGELAEHASLETAPADAQLPPRPIEQSLVEIHEPEDTAEAAETPIDVVASEEVQAASGLVNLVDADPVAHDNVEVVDADIAEIEPAGNVVIVDEDGELAPLNPASRPLLASTADVAVEDAEEEIHVQSDSSKPVAFEAPALAVGEIAAMADAVEPALDTGLTSEPTGVADRAGFDIEALADRDVAVEPTAVAFTAFDETSDLSTEAMAVAGEQLAPVADESHAPTIEGNWLSPVDANAAAALAEALPAPLDTAGESATDHAGTVTLELSGPSAIVEASEPLIAEPAPLDGSTLSTAASLPLGTEDDSFGPSLLEELAASLAAPETPVTAAPLAAPMSINDLDLAWGEELAEQSTARADDNVAIADEAATDDNRPFDDRSMRIMPEAGHQAPVSQPNAPRGQSVINVNVPSMEEFEASFHDAFADALAMAEGANFGSMNAPPVPKPVEQAPVAPQRPAAPKWELDESLLDQLEQPGANPMAGAMGSNSSNIGGAAAFMSLGGIGWIGDESASEFEAVPSSIHAVNPNTMRPLLGAAGKQIGGALAARRASRRRRPVPGDVSTDEITTAEITTPETSATAAAEMSPSASVTTHDASPSAQALTAEPPVADQAESDTATDLSGGEVDELAELMATTAEPEANTNSEDGPSIGSSDDQLFADRGVAVEETLTRDEVAIDEPRPATPRFEAPTQIPAVPLPRPVRRAKPASIADVDQTLAAAASASPFAEQALPLIDAFSGRVAPPTQQLDDALAKFGAADGRIKGQPSITQDRPAQDDLADQLPVGSPFASMASIDEIAPLGSGVRRTRQTINKLPLLIGLMAGLMALAALGAWYAPVAVTVRGEVSFTNIEKLSDLDRAATQDKIRGTLANLDQPARQALDDRYGNGFLDHRDLYTPIVDKARFDPAQPGTLILTYTSSINQQEGDVARMNELAKQVIKANQPLLDAQHKLQDQAQILERSIARDRERVATLGREIERLTSIAESGPDGKDIRRAETDAAQLEDAKKAAVADLDAKEAELKRLESNPMAFVPASLIQEEATQLADATDSLAVTPTTKPTTDAQAELARLVAQLDATKTRLDQLEAAQNPEAKSARDGFDAALDAFSKDVETARTALGDRPEVLKYVEAASKLQAQTRTITETLIRRQQQGLTQMNELKQRIADLKGAHHDQLASGDEELRKWNDQIAINERLLNSSRDDHADPEAIKKIEGDIKLLKTMVAGKEEQLQDPQQQSVDEKLEEMLKTTQRNMEADRADNEKMLADIQEEFRAQQPALEKLPDDQKKLGESLAGRLAQIDLSRQRYADSLVKVAGGEALQVTDLRKKVDELKASVARQQPLADAEAVAQAADMERRTATAKLVDDARAKVIAARTVRDSAVAAYEAKAQALAAIVAKRDAASNARRQKEAMEMESKDVNARVSKEIADLDSNTVRLATAVVPAGPPIVRVIEPPHGDPRLTYGASAVGILGLIFGPLIYRENRNRPAAARTQTQSSNSNVVPGNAHIA